MDNPATSQSGDNQVWPDERGRFGDYGGRFVAETLMPPILSLEAAYEDAKADPSFQAELDDFMTHYVGRPSPLYFAERLTDHAGGILRPALVLATGVAAGNSPFSELQQGTRREDLHHDPG